MTPDLTSILLQYGGPFGVGALFLFCFLRGLIVPAAVYRDVVEDRDKWRAIAMSGADIAERLAPTEAGKGKT